ncbi:MAG: hypothetical protein LBP71_02550 [Spirochaetaceae bacterium]|jgi:hypothetical protein|nr:hypothetical protein [Spirochaetaceae bacterium]
MKRCPVCFGLVNKKATKCKHCASDLGENNIEYYNYINNGFSLIDREFEAFNQKIESIKGAIFPRHQYSEEELLHSSHLDKIRAIVGKMESDIENWNNRGRFSTQLKEYYDDKLSVLNDRFQFMMRRLKSRRYSIWERISEFVICSYYFIINIALHHIKGIIIPYMKSSNTIMKPFMVLQKTADNFEHFLNEMQQNTKEEMVRDITYPNRA